METKLSIKQVLIDLISILPQITKKFGKDEKYKKLIHFLNEKDYYNDDELPYPTLKQIETEQELKLIH